MASAATGGGVPTPPPETAAAKPRMSSDPAMMTVFQGAREVERPAFSIAFMVVSFWFGASPSTAAGRLGLPAAAGCGGYGAHSRKEDFRRAYRGAGRRLRSVVRTAA
jgi:hypothetical protein